MKANGRIRFLLWLAMGFASPASFGAPRGLKDYAPVREEKEIFRNRVRIRNSIATRKTPALMNPEDLDFDRARRFKLDQKTAELIKQLEQLIKRPGQRGRVGELKMRLAELYYDRSQYTAATEASRWEERIKEWENLSESDRAKTPRPELRTPRANALRQRALAIYQDLEKMSRGRKAGIRRDEVLYFLASTQRDLGRLNAAEPFYKELSEQFPKSSRRYSARLNLADLYFDRGDFEPAIPLYLAVASGEGAPRDGSAEQIKSYALYKLGWAYLNTGAFDRSVLAFKRTIDSAAKSGDERKIVLKREAFFDLARAYALSGAFREAESYFESAGKDGAEGLERFRSEAAAAARDQGKPAEALRYYDKLIAANPTAPEARDYGVEKVRIVERTNNPAALARALDEFAGRYGEGSAWLQAQPPAVRSGAGDEVAALLRREAKNSHRLAQQKNDDALFKNARAFYTVYFKHVPRPNGDGKENLHEMRFYYGELLYRLGEFDPAAQYYAQAGAGKYGSASAYARILSLQKAAADGKNSAASQQLVEATQEFVNEYPEDDRVGDLLYTSAQEAFKGGDSKESIRTLQTVMQRFAGEKRGVEAAERILFILEKNQAYEQVVVESDLMLQNARLLKTGGKEFRERLIDYRQKGSFKRAETLADPEDRGQAFLKLAQDLKGELQEKALNNAIIFAREGQDRPTEMRAQQLLVKNHPKSSFAKDVYFKMGELAARDGKWSEAKKNYESYIRNYGTGASGKGAKDIEAARWNWIFIESQIQEGWYASFNPRRTLDSKLVSALESFVRDYPKSENRTKALEILAFRRGITRAGVATLARTPGLNAAQKRIVQEAEVVAQARAGDNSAAIVRANPPNPQRSDLLKEAVGKLAFELVEPKFKNYSKQSLNYSTAKFATSLKQKLNSLEDLEREYLRVVSYGNGDAALKSLERLSRLYQGLGRDILKAPAAKEELAGFADPLIKKSQSFLKTCFDKAAELKIGGTGLRACQNTAAETGAEFANIGQEKFPEPRWLPTLGSAEAGLPLIQAAIDSFQKGRFGEAGLALTILSERKDIEVNPAQRQVLENLEGLSLYRNGSSEAAVRSFRKASESANSSVKAAALKNLAAVYLNVADFDQALDAIAPIAGVDADTALMAGLAHKGVGDIAEAIDAYERGLQLAPNDALLNYNRSFALAASDLHFEASKSIQRYIEIARPSPNDVSRLLYRRWKAKSSNEKMSDEIF